MVEDSQNNDQPELDSMRDVVNSRVQEEASEHPEKKKDEPKISSSFFFPCLEMEELGPAILYAELKRGELLFNPFSQPQKIY